MKTQTIAIALLLVSFASFAQNEKQIKKTEISIEIDPATFVFNGYAIHLRIQPKNSDHLLVGAGIYAMDFPDLIVDFNPENKNKGWEVRLNSGIGLFGEYHFSEVNRKFFIGVQLATQEYKIKKGDEVGSENYNTFLGLGYAGYTIKPFNNNGLYFKPWLGIGYTKQIAGESKLGDSQYDVAPILLFAALHLGYTF